jgi:DNA-binding HxlR family transcriptional regulator
MRSVTAPPQKATRGPAGPAGPLQQASLSILTTKVKKIPFPSRGIGGDRRPHKPGICASQPAIARILKYSLHLASDIGKVCGVSGKPNSKRRSGCPVSISLEMLGDRWSLLVIRDLMVRGLRTFREFQASGEGIATNILADRLRKLEATGIITAEEEKTDRRRVNYRLTEKGIDLAPVLLDLLIWGARYEATKVPCALMEKLEKNREDVLAEVRRRWRERDSAPLLPKFGYQIVGRGAVP